MSSSLYFSINEKLISDCGVFINFWKFCFFSTNNLLSKNDALSIAQVE